MIVKDSELLTLVVAGKALVNIAERAAKDDAVSVVEMSKLNVALIAIGDVVALMPDRAAVLDAAS